MPHYTKHLINHLKSCHPESSVLLAETGQKNECSYCGKIFKYNYSMKKHVESLHEAPTVPCHICGILLKGQKTLTSHLKSVHEKTVRHHCPEPGCTMTAVNSHHLKVFVSKIYFTNVRLSNVCVYISLTFRTILQSYIVDKPGIFSSSNTLKRIGTTYHQNNFHLYKYHRYVCSVCGKEHGYYKALKHCQDRHKGRFMHPCTLCDKKYLDKV